MFGWSISASACRSASKRAMTCRESMPALISLTATSRLTGSVCWAIQTLPMPPSPICSSSLYGPITVPGLSVVGWSMVAGNARRRTVQQAVWAVGGGQQRLDEGDPGLVPRRTPRGRTAADGPDRGYRGRHGRSPRCPAVMRSCDPPRRDAWPVQNTMRETGDGPVPVFSFAFS